jgi:preprotein translocase subunit SecD
VLILGAVFVLGVTFLLAYALLREKDPLERGPSTLSRPVSFVPVQAAADGPCRPGWLEDPSDGKCLQTGSGMTVRRVEGIRVQTPGGASGRTGYTVAISFGSTDARTFAAMTEAAARRQDPANRIAIVAEGRVLSAPAVATAITGGQVEISGPSTRFTREYTEDLVRRITGE